MKKRFLKFIFQTGIIIFISAPGYLIIVIAKTIYGGPDLFWTILRVGFIFASFNVTRIILNFKNN